MAQALNLLMSGSTFLSYGEELGMKGSGKDENKRAPMYWSDDAGCPGLCGGPPGMEVFEMKFPGCENQLADGDSILDPAEPDFGCKFRRMRRMKAGRVLTDERFVIHQISAFH